MTEPAHTAKVDKFSEAAGTGRDAADQAEVEKRWPGHEGPVADVVMD